MITELSTSQNNFEIKNGQGRAAPNSFEENRTQLSGSFAEHLRTDPAIAPAMAPVAGGGGGTIYWDPSGDNVWVLGGKKDNNPMMNLAHEMFHGRDANRGLSWDRQHASGLYNGLSKAEWQASYQENILRSQFGLPLREYYRSGVNAAGNPIGGAPPRILDANNLPERPSWVPITW